MQKILLLISKLLIGFFLFLAQSIAYASSNNYKKLSGFPISNWEIITILVIAIIILISPRKWKTRIFGTALGCLVIYLLVINFETLVTLIHIRD